MKKKVFSLLLLFVYHIVLYSQVNLQTGSAIFSLPMFNWKDGKSRLSSLVALNYNSGNGLKVNEFASNVGQGWNLLAGGVVTRVQVGQPDDQKPKEGVEDDISKYPPGYLYSTDSATKGCPEGLTKYPIFEGKNKIYKPLNRDDADKELDYFYFQFNGRSGVFVVNDDLTGTCLGDSKLKIWFSKNESSINNSIPLRTTIDTFYIQDENSLIYTYSTLDLTKILKGGYSDKNSIEEKTLPKFEGGKVYYQNSFDKIPGITYMVGAWHLTKIQDGLTGRTIIFNYTPRNIDVLGDIQLMYFKDKDYSVVSQKKSKSISPVLSSIEYPDGHRIQFNYEKERLDLKGAYALTSVEIKYKDRYVSKFSLTSDYFILNRFGTPITDYQKQSARLCLLSVKQAGVDLKAEEKPYLFDYYIGSSVPDDIVPPPFFYCKDVWGYYNGYNSKASNNETLPLNKTSLDLTNNQIKGLCFLKDDNTTSLYTVKSGYAKNGLLKEITYPSGGSLMYEYEQNKGMLDGVEMMIGGVHISQIKSTDGGFSNGDDNPLSTHYNYVLGSSNQSSLWGFEQPSNKMDNVGFYKPEQKKYKFPAGCKFKYQYPGLLTPEDKMSVSSLQNTLSAVNSVLNVVGIAMEIKDVAMLLTKTGVTWLSIGSLALSVGLDVLSCFRSGEKTINSTIYYNTDLNAANPLPMQFKRVEVVPSTGEVGKTIHVFTSDQQYPLWLGEDNSINNINYTMRQRFATWAYGLPLSTIVYDSQGNKKKETNYSYKDCYSTKEYDTTPQWQSGNPPQKRCGSGNLVGHQEIYMKDVNSFSATYNTWQWRDSGINEIACPIVPQNLVINGDFEQGENGFESDYTMKPSGSSTGTGDASVTNNPYTSNSGWCQTGDHTSGSGKMLVVDGSITDPTKKFWHTVINVEPNTLYELSFWCMTLYTPSATIQVNANGIQIREENTPESPCVWQQKTVLWNSGQNTTANLDFIAPLGFGLGNDFAIDDIVVIKLGEDLTKL